MSQILRRRCDKSRRNSIFPDPNEVRQQVRTSSSALNLSVPQSSSEARMRLSLSMTINGTPRRIELDDPRVTLLDLLRERLHLTGTKKGCDRGQCGACTVLLDSRRINACLALAASCDGSTVQTIEGVAQGGCPAPGAGRFHRA